MSRRYYLCIFVLAAWSLTAHAQEAPADASSEAAAEPQTVETEAVEPEITQAPEISLDPDWPKNVRPLSPERSTMTDDWFGLGPAMRDLGIDMKFYWNSHYYAVLKGGRDTGGGKHSATYDWLITLDLEKMGLLKNSEMLMHARQQWGASVNRYTGANQQVNDDADGDRSLYVDQLWIRHHFLDNAITLQYGYLDFQTIVDRNVYANSEDKQFMNAALDNNPLFPTASAAGLGAALYLRPCDWYEVIVGAADAERLPLYKPGFSTTFHDRALFLYWLEQNFKLKIPGPNGDLDGNYRFGLIYDPIARPQFRYPWQGGSAQRGDDWGWYMSFDQQVYKENDKDKQGLGWFFRYAWRHDDIPHDAGFFSEFWSTGLAYTGLIPERDHDTLGLAVAQLMSSETYRRRIDNEAGNETIYELYYAIEVFPWLVITPDIQYIDNPGGTDSDEISHAIAGGLKARITF